MLSEVTDQIVARKQLESVNQKLEEFAYAASHDLQEPLRNVGIYSQLILKQLETDDPNLKQYGEFVRNGVLRMETLIRDLLAYSRAVHARDGASEKADLLGCFSQAVSTLNKAIESSAAVVVADSLPTVRGDAGQLALVFQNLLSNALKYARKEVAPQIRVSAVTKGENEVIAFRDNGIGFEQKYAEQIFGLFTRLHKEEYAGTGLGLAICRRTIERYGGHMWAEGRPGEGATFYFSLPAVEG